MSDELPPSNAANDVLLVFDADAFDAALRSLLELPNVAEVRAAIGALRAAWLVAPPEGAETSGSLSFTFSYLSDELAQIAAALSVERARYYIERLRRSATDERTNGVNDLNLNRWKSYSDIHTDSLWQIDRRDTSGVHTAGYWGNFVPQIPSQMMRRYTRRGDWVLDAFAGSGTSLIEARRLGRNCVGIELQPHVAEQSRETIAAEPTPYDVVSEIVVGDSTNYDVRGLLNQYGQECVQLVMLHPPYHDIIRFSEDPRDLSNAASAEHFLEQLGQVVENVAPVLQRDRYLVLVIGDKYARGEWYPLGFRAMEATQQRGFNLKSIVVKNFDSTTGKRAQKELWRYRALAGGFFVFKHEYIFIFEKK